MNIQTEKMCRAKVHGKGHGASMPGLGAPLPQQFHVFTNPEGLRTASFWDFMGSHLIGVISHELHFQPFPPLKRMGAGLKSLS